MKEITAEYFFQRTGRKPTPGELMQARCPHAGQPDHENCGWNWEEDCPALEQLTWEPGNLFCPDRVKFEERIRRTGAIKSKGDHNAQD